MLQSCELIAAAVLISFCLKTTAYIHSNYNKEKIMARRSDIEGAFINAISRAEDGWLILTTADFVRDLAAVNRDWSYDEANR